MGFSRSFGVSFALLGGALSVVGFSGVSLGAPVPQEGSAGKAARAYIPADLDDALKQLDKILPAKTREEMRKGKEGDMSRYHMGLGLWMRNNWGLWGGSRLSKWFSGHAVFHPDDMSMVILTSYYRRLHGKPIELAKQVKAIQAFYADAEKVEEAEKKKAAATRIAIKGMMLGVTVAPGEAAVVDFPHLANDSFRVRYAAPFSGGVLLTAKRFNADSIGKKPDFFIQSFFLDLTDDTLHPIEAGPGETVEDGVVIGGNAYLNCLGEKSGRILRLGTGGRTFLPWPGWSSRTIRLGLEVGRDGNATSLLAVGSSQVARWNGKAWEDLPSSGQELPFCALPAKKIGERIFFRDEGEHEDDKRLSWISGEKALTIFDQDVGVVGSEGPRWENVWDYTMSTLGELWIATGSSINSQSLVRWTPSGGYRVALWNDSVKWTPNLLTFDDSQSKGPEHRFAVTGLETGAQGVTAVGPHGLFNLREGQVHAELEFRHAPQDWFPSELLTLSSSVRLVGGHFGGLFLLRRSGDGRTTARGLDDRMGAAKRF